MKNNANSKAKKTQNRSSSKVGSTRNNINSKSPKIRTFSHNQMGQHQKSNKGDYLINEWLPRGSIVSIFGDTGIGKSYFTYYLALCLGTGTQFNQQVPIVSKVVIVDAEMMVRDIFKRYKMLLDTIGEKGKSLSDQNVKFLSKDIITNIEIDFASKEFRDKMEDVIVSEKFDVIVLDNIGAAFSSDLNTGSELRIFYSWMKSMSSKHKTTFLIVAHTGKNEKSGLTGSKKQLNYANTIIKLEAGNRNANTLDIKYANVKVRDAPCKEGLNFRVLFKDGKISEVSATGYFSGIPLEVVLPELEGKDEKLKEKDKDILFLIADGKTNKEIAFILGVMTGGISKRIQNLEKKKYVISNKGKYSLTDLGQEVISAEPDFIKFEIFESGNIPFEDPNDKGFDF